MASLLKIVSTGMQDERLQPPKGQPNLDSFLMVIIKTGRYATNWSRIDFDTKPDFGSKAIIRLPTKGEMIGRVYLVAVMPDIRSQQQVAYYTRKPIRLANTNYTSVNMYDGNGHYLDSVTIIYQPTSQPYGLANFTGVQLDDLIVGGVYTLTYNVPQGSFALLMTTRALNTPQFNLLNSDTLVITGGQYFTNLQTAVTPSSFIGSSYNGINFRVSNAPESIISGTIYSLAYNDQKYIAGGTSSLPPTQMIIESNAKQIITVPGTGTPYKIAYNDAPGYTGAKYVGVGSWTTGTMVWSNDGITWSQPVWPGGESSGIGRSVVWIAATQTWMAIGEWPTGIISRSVNGIDWNSPEYITSVATISGPIAQTFMDALIGYNGILSQWSGESDTNTNALLAYPPTFDSNTNNNIMIAYQNIIDSIDYGDGTRSYISDRISQIDTAITNLKDALSQFKNLLTAMRNILTTNNNYTPTPPGFGHPANCDAVLNAAITALQKYYNDILFLNATPTGFYIGELAAYLGDLQNNYFAVINYIAASDRYYSQVLMTGNFPNKLDEFIYFFTGVAEPGQTPLIGIKNLINTALLLDPNASILAVSPNFTPSGVRSQFPVYTADPISSKWTIGFATPHTFLVGDDVTVMLDPNFSNGVCTIESKTSNTITINTAIKCKVPPTLLLSSTVTFNKNLTNYDVQSCLADPLTNNRWIITGTVTSTLPDRLIVGDKVTLAGFTLQNGFTPAFDSNNLNTEFTIVSIGTSTISIDIISPSVPVIPSIPPAPPSTSPDTIIPGTLSATIVHEKIATSIIIPDGTSWTFDLGITPHFFTDSGSLSKIVLSNFSSSNFQGDFTVVSIPLDDTYQPDRTKLTISTSSVVSAPDSGNITLQNGNVWYDVITENDRLDIRGTGDALGLAAANLQSESGEFFTYVGVLGSFKAEVLDNINYQLTNIGPIDFSPISSGQLKSIAVNGFNIVVSGRFYGPLSPFSGSQGPFSGTIIQSSDGGVSWISPTDPGGTGGLGDDPAAIGNAVAWTGSIWVATGVWIGQSFAANSISFSEDGIRWLEAINPPQINPSLNDDYPSKKSNGSFCIGTSIAVNSSEMIIGGKWTTLPINEKTSVTICTMTKASGTSLGYTWGTLIRTTDIDTNILRILNIAYYKPTTGTPVYLLLGRWKDSIGLGLGAISVSNNGSSWSQPIIPYDPGLTGSTGYAAATNGNIWIVIGTFVVGKLDGGSAVDETIGTSSITVSTDITGLEWNAPIGPNNIIGVGYDIIYVSEELFIAVGNWATGYITYSTTNGTTWVAPFKLTDDQGRIIRGSPRSISKTAIIPPDPGNPALPPTYIIAGQFSVGTIGNYTYYPFVTVQISSAGDITNVKLREIPNFDNFLHKVKSVVWNEQSGGQAKYVAITTNGLLTYSTNLVNWSTPIRPSNVIGYPPYGSSVSWNGAQFAATGFWNDGMITTSTDGINWTAPVMPPNITGYSVAEGLIWNGSKWIIAGNFLSAQSIEIGNIVPFSYGISFTVPTNPLFATNEELNNVNVAWSPSESKWIAIGQWTDILNNIGYISKSTDGLNWITANTIPGIFYIYDIQQDPFTPAYLSVVNNKVYILGSILYNSITLMTSPDTISWSNITTEYAGQATGICWNGTIWVAVGVFAIIQWGNSIRANIIYSSDGITWSAPINPDFTTYKILLDLKADPLVAPYLYGNYVKVEGQLNGVAWNGSYFVAVGNYNVIIGRPNSTQVIYDICQIVKSSDSIDWKPIEVDLGILTDGNDADNTGYGIAWNGSMWIAVGTWKYVNTNKNIVNGTITRSTDGINWTRPTSPQNVLNSITQSYGYGIAWNGYIWVAVGQWYNSSNQIYLTSTSTDGIMWSNAISPVTELDVTDIVLYSVTWNGTQFIAVGKITTSSTFGIIMTSPDGLNWSYTIDQNSNGFKAIASKRSLPYTLPQTFDPNLQVNSYPSSPGNYQLTWLRDPVYGTGSQFVNSETTDRITQSFTATQRTQWLTFGSYYNSSQPVVMTLTKVSPENPVFVTDLVGPHFGWTNNLGHSIVDTTTLTIGGNLVETLSGQLMEVIDEFQTPLEKVSEKNRQLCRSDNGFNQITYGFSNLNQTVTTHLPFWFSRGDPGCALPIDALNVDEVRVTVNFKPVTSLYYTDSRNITPIVNAEGGSLQPMQGSPFYYEDTSGVLMPHIEPNRLYNKALLPFPKLNMTSQLAIQDSYLLVEYIYLDKAEANRFRIADIQVPIVQHYIANPQDNRSTPYTRINLDIPNPTRDLFFYCQRYEAPSFNAHFLATRDLCRGANPYGLWWPDASGLDARLYGNLRPAFSTSGSEPIRWLSLNYNESLTRYSTENVAVFRSLLPSMEQRKAPWLNRYYYNLPFGYQNGLNPLSMPMGEANMDKIKRVTLALGFHGPTGDPTDVYADRFFTRVFAETYNILRVYGGRGTTMFAY